MEVLQVLKYSINEERREKQYRRGLVHGRELGNARGGAAEASESASFDPEVPEQEQDGNFIPLRIRDIVQVMREAGEDTVDS